MTKRILICSLLLAACSLLPAYDFGLLLDQKAELSGAGGGAVSDTDFSYNGILVPRLGWLLGDAAELGISAGLNFQDDPWSLIPELLETGISWRSSLLEFSLGRMDCSDPLGYVASGLFDGARLSLGTEAGIFSAGAWYAGLLYKKRANIEMTHEEWEQNNIEPLDYGDFAGTYFAPRRFLAALGWEHPGLAGRFLARLSLIGQFDLTGAELNSQYLVGKIAVPAGAFSLGLGGSIGLMQLAGDADAAFAAELGLGWKGASQGLSLAGIYASGEGGSIAAFQPVTTNTFGNMLKPRLSGISMLSLEYMARVQRSLSLGLSSSYFVYTGSGMGERLLGGEFFGSLFWSPFSDLSVNLGAGAFLPSLGDVAPDGDAFWRVELNAVISLF